MHVQVIEFGVFELVGLGLDGLPALSAEVILGLIVRAFAVAQEVDHFFGAAVSLFGALQPVRELEPA